MARVWVFLACSVALCGPIVSESRAHAMAAAPEVEAWLDSMIGCTGADLAPPAEAIRLEFGIDFLWAPSPQEMDRIRERVKDKPEHPDRWMLTLERRWKQPDQNLYVIWLGGNAFRRSITRVGNEESDLDDSVSRFGAWRLTSTTLVVADEQDAARTGPMRSALDSTMWDAIGLFTGGLHRLAGVGGARIVKRQGNAWTLTMRNVVAGQSIEAHASGTWDEAQKVGTVDPIVYKSHGEGGSPGGFTLEAADWAFRGEPARWTAGTVTERRLTNELDRRVKFQSLRAISTSDLQAALTVPEASGTDVLRGPSRFTAVEDHRSSAPVVRLSTPGGWVEQSLADARGASEQQRSRDRLRVVGWVLAGVIVGALVLIRVRRGFA